MPGLPILVLMAVTAEQLRTTVSDRARTETFVGPGFVFSLLVAAAGFVRVAAGGGLSGMWADDGVFLEVVHGTSPWGSITYAHQGYLNLAPMLVATLLEWVPVSVVPIVYAVAWSIVVGALASLVAATSETFLSSPWSRAMLGASVALIPVIGYESVGSIANLQWSLLAASTVAVVGSRRRATAYVVALTALSDVGAGHVA